MNKCKHLNTKELDLWFWTKRVDNYNEPVLICEDCKRTFFPFIIKRPLMGYGED